MAADDPLDQLELRRELLRPGSLWRRLDVVAETGSTNADLADLARAGADGGSVLIAGGPRFDPMMAGQLGVDRVFSRGTTPGEVASYLVHAMKESK